MTARADFASVGAVRAFEELMQAYQGGDSQAFRALFQALSPRLFRYLAAYSGAGTADDLLQQTWLEVHRARASYDPRRPLLPWLFAIARNVRRHATRGALRAAAREHRSVVEHSAALAVEPSWEDILAVREQLALLPETQQEVVLMLKFADLSIEEAAAALGVSSGAVKQKAHRAYEKLRTTLATEPPRPAVVGAPPPKEAS